MERFLSEKYSTELSTGSNKLDLTLKLSPCSENEEKMRLLRKDESQWGPFEPFLNRSWSLPAEAEKGLLGLEDLKTMKKVETVERMRMMMERQRKVAASEAGNDTFTSGSYNIPHKDQSPRPSSPEGGVSSNSIMQTPAKKENYNSTLSQKTTIAKEIPPSPAHTKLKNPAKKVKLGNYCSLKGDVMEILRQMPSVTTTGDGPNGKRIEGFLYKYMNGQICIVCVCHGNFLTPAEFVMHAGGKEVANPMKHITVYSNSF